MESHDEVPHCWPPPPATEHLTPPPLPSDPSEPPPVETPWVRVTPLTVGAAAIRSLLPFTPVLFGMIVFSGSGESEGIFSLGFLTIILVFIVGAQIVRWWRTTYRLTEERLELRTGLLVTSHRSIPRDRVRRVDLTTPLFHRVLGISVVTIGTGESASSESESLTLDALPSLEAAQLRDALLEPQLLDDMPSQQHGETFSVNSPDYGRASDDELQQPRAKDESLAGQFVTPAAHAATAVSSSRSMRTLAKFSWAWAPYGLFSAMTLWLPFLIIGGLYQIINSWTSESLTTDLVEQSGNFVSNTAVVTLVIVVGVGAIVIGTLGSLVTYFINWFGFVLMKDRANVLHSERGLFTRYSRTFDLSRVRGVSWTQTVPLRYLRGGRLHIIAQGLSGTDGDTGPRVDSLLPAAPTTAASPVVIDLCGFDALRIPLLSHPIGALRRRQIRALVTSVIGIAAAVLIWRFTEFAAAAWAVGIFIPIVAWVLAHAAYRGLGHTLTDTHLITRVGSWTRQTVALERNGIIGLSIQQTFFQRRRGLATLWAVTAAGSGAYSVIDVSLQQAMSLAIRCDPTVTAPMSEMLDSNAVGASAGTRNSPWL